MAGCRLQVAAVEAEMRELLIENESNKRTMEERVKKLNHAFSELQQGVFWTFPIRLERRKKYLSSFPVRRFCCA